MIESLTPEQENRLAEFRDKWVRIGLCTDPADRKAAEKGITKAYKIASLEPPKIVWCSSPIALALTRLLVLEVLKEASVRDSVRDSVWASVRDSVRDSVWASVRASVRDSVRDSVGDSVNGQHDAPWLGFFDYFSEVCGLRQQTQDLVGLWEISRSAGWWLPHEKTCWISERTCVVNQDDAKRLHCATGPALAYPDGWAIWAWRGVRVPQNWIEASDELAPETALTWRNAEQRRAACEILGWERLLEQMNARLIDKDPDDTIGQLYEVTHEAVGGHAKFLRMYCPTGRWFAEPVPPDMETALQANAWGWGLEPKHYNPSFQA